MRHGLQVHRLQLFPETNLNGGSETGDLTAPHAGRDPSSRATLMNKTTSKLHHGLIALALTALVSGCSAEESLGQQLARGETALTQGELKTALIELKNVLQKDSQNQRARLLLGQAYLRAGDAAAAEQELQKALKLGAQNNDAQPWLMQAWLQQGKFAQVKDLAIAETTAPQLRAQLLAIQADALQTADDLGGHRTKQRWR